MGDLNSRDEASPDTRVALLGIRDQPPGSDPPIAEPCLGQYRIPNIAIPGLRQSSPSNRGCEPQG